MKETRIKKERLNKNKTLSKDKDIYKSINTSRRMKYIFLNTIF